MANKFLKRFRTALQLEDIEKPKEVKPPKKEPVSLKRKLYRPSMEFKGGKAFPIEEREYQDESGIYKRKKREHTALGVKGGK